jgi:D-serine deaminase-like pyridoxal phosphate-dependent protein
MNTNIDTPALLVDLDLVEANIQTLLRHLKGTGVQPRPHLKTAKSPDVARLLAAAGIERFCVAKLGEAEVFAKAGFDDLMIVSEIVGAVKLARLAALHQDHPRIRTVVDSIEGARGLNDAVAANGKPLDILIELDVGQGRCGVPPGEPALVLAQAIATMPHLRLVGVHGYEGHLQHVGDPDVKRQRCEAAMQSLGSTVELLRQAGHSVETVTTGGTGTYRLCAQHPIVNEVQPGSFVFLDGAYRKALGANNEYANALVVLATVISCPTPLRAVVDAGLKALSTDMGNAEPRDLPGVRYRPAGDEYGMLEWGPELNLSLAIGDQVALIPSHIDTTVNLYDTYHAYSDDRFVARWAISARGKTQ